MEVAEGPVARLAAFLHHRLLWLLVAAYALAGSAPAAGLWLRSANLGTVEMFGQPITASVPSLLLSVLLFNAGLGVEPARLHDLFGRAGLLLAGLLANVAVPLAFILAVSATLTFWHNPTEVQYILVGLALIASMPVAGSSTAWSQNANGDLALSLGLVVGSTVLSPLTTPAVLHAVGWVAEGTFADCLHRLAAGGTSSFLVAFVMVPSVLGILVRCLSGGTRLKRVRPGLKVINSVTILLLCYANAAVALPKTFAKPDWDFLAVMLVIVTGLCVTGFLAGVALARWFGADPGRRASLMFGLGMTNNGTGLVLATTALADVPDVMLPVIFYNLVQHVVAAFADAVMRPADSVRRQTSIDVSTGRKGFMTRRRRLLVLAFVVSSVCVAFGVWASNYHLRNFSTVEPGVLYRSGQLTPTGLKYAIHRHGIKTVVTLRADSDPAKPNCDEWEEAVCDAHDVRHIHLVPRTWCVGESGELPARQMVREFLAVMDDPSNHPVLVHCFAGVHRTGTLCAVYRMEYQHWHADRAITEMEVFGFLPGQNRKAVEEYLREYRLQR